MAATAQVIRINGQGYRKPEGRADCGFGVGLTERQRQELEARVAKVQRLIGDKQFGIAPSKAAVLRKAMALGLDKMERSASKRR